MNQIIDLCKIKQDKFNFDTGMHNIKEVIQEVIELR